MIEFPNGIINYGSQFFFLTCWVPDPIETCAEMPWSIEMSFDSVSDFAEIEKKIVCQLLTMKIGWQLSH